ncbi:MAG: aminopeptidase P family protein [Burkholderiales bacterium]|nr:aminopeptidase P family protein [Burkholderiales bacterium]
MSIEKKLTTLRTEMQKNKIDIYLIPSVDAHNNEYLPECWERRPWISNFTGSAGEALVTMEHAYLWTDGRYFLQAEQELDAKNYTLMKQVGFASEIESWILANGEGKTLGVDPKVLSADRANSLQNLMPKINAKIVFLEENLVDTSRIVMNEKLILPTAPVFKHEDRYSGISIQDKLSYVRQELKVMGADYLALNVLDEIAWLFNIRGNDIKFNPLVISYAVIGQDNACLFIDINKVPEDIKQEFQNLNIILMDYNKIAEKLSSLTGSVAFDTKTSNHWMIKNLNPEAQIIKTKSPIIIAKACKNDIEQKWARYAHLKDAVSVIGFLSWLNSNWKNGVDELSAQEKLLEFRSRQEHFKQESFAPISGFAENGALIHYRSSSKTNKIIDDSNMYLIDSGGQYLEGTTDITRTIHLGNPTAEQKKHYTLVLKGHLALSRTKFPVATCGEHLDSLARQYLWNEYLEYNHGTGHGVGSFLCVHEGPQKISKAISGAPLKDGMIVSNEPGLYLSGLYGIRIENLCLVKDCHVSNQKFEFGPFLEFETLTFVPYCKKLIDFSIIDAIEIKQLKDYYAEISTKVRHLLSSEEIAWFDNEIHI